MNEILSSLHQRKSVRAGLLSMANEKERERTAYRAVTAYVRSRAPGRRGFIVRRGFGASARSPDPPPAGQTARWRTGSGSG